MNEFQKKNIEACRKIWANRFSARALEFTENDGGKIGLYYTAWGETPHGKIGIVIYDDEAGVSYTDNRWSRWYKFLRGGWGLPSFIFEKPDYDSPEDLSAAFRQRLSALIEKATTETH